jgi:hypothetical protein
MLVREKKAVEGGKIDRPRLLIYGISVEIRL